jgi:hypothetical protein
MLESADSLKEKYHVPLNHDSGVLAVIAMYNQDLLWFLFHHSTMQAPYSLVPKLK